MAVKDVLLGVLVAVIWGVNFSIIKLGLSSVDPMLLAALRFSLASIPLVFVLPKPKNISLAAIALFGLIFGLGVWGMVNLSLSMGVSAGVTSLILQFSVYFTVLFGLWVFKECITLSKIIGMGISLFGLVLLIVAKDQSSAPIIGLMLVLIGAFSLSLTNLMIKKIMPQDGLAFLVWSSMFAVLPLMTLWYIQNPEPDLIATLETIDTTGWFSVIFQTYITTLFAYWIWNFLLKKYPISNVAPLALLVPVFGFLSSIWWFDEPMTATKITASTLIFIGLVVFIPIKPKKT